MIWTQRPAPHRALRLAGLREHQVQYLADEAQLGAR